MKQVFKRLLGAIPVLIGVVLLIFLMLRVIPGNPVLTLLEEHYNDQTIARLTESMGLDQPIMVQFFKYVGGLFRGDLGTSYKYSRPVFEMIREAFPNTLKLACMGVIFAWIVGLVSGVIAAIRQNKLLDRMFMGFALIGVSMPVFMTSLFLQYLLFKHLKQYYLRQK